MKHGSSLRFHGSKGNCYEGSFIMSTVDEVLINRIRKLLRQNPRGLNISEISARLKVGRDSIIKYLEVLEATGLVESSFHGNARVFYAARRVQASTLLDLSLDLVCTLDSQQSFVFTNHKFLNFFGLSENEVVGQKIPEIRCEGRIDPVFTSLFSDLPAGEEVREISWQKEGKEFHLKIRSIPTLFEDGSKGATILMEDITREWEYVAGLEFLARTAGDLTEMGDDENIYQYIADRVYELEPGSTLQSVPSMPGRGRSPSGVWREILRCWMDAEESLAIS